MTSATSLLPSTNPTPTTTTVSTSKEWVLPPRPKNGRKTGCNIKKRKSINSIIESNPEESKEKEKKNPQINLLNKNIKSIDKENYQLKSHLLCLIHDYKQLRQIVLNGGVNMDNEGSTRKRSYHELVDPMNDLISNMNGLTHDPSSPMLSEEDDYEEDDEFWNRAKYEQDDFFNYLNFDDTSSKLDDESAKLLSQIEEEGELPDEEEVEEDIESPNLSRSTSPSAMSESDENSLMTSLTRSTTVSTNNSFMNINSKPILYSNNLHSQPPFKFYDLPASTAKKSFTFEDFGKSNDDLMSIIQEDNYNQVTDFLEEKLIDNNLNYYENINHNNHWK